MLWGLVVLLAAVLLGPAAAPAAAQNVGSVTICHATGSVTSPYQLLNLSGVGADVGGHAAHSGDIIPVFFYSNATGGMTRYDGSAAYNTTAGRAVWDAGCTIPENVSGRITIVKRIVPANDPGRFNLLLNGQVVASNVGNGGSSPQITVLAPGNYIVDESAAPGTNLADYDASVECVSQRGSFDPPPPVTVEIRVLDTWVCTITNVRRTQPPTDVCPNIPGVQTSIPAGLILVNGNCVAPPTDVCPNIDGVQTVIPPGMVIVNGNCVIPPGPGPDVCPNIAGAQTVIPPGMILVNGNCVTPPDDVCPNIAGTQTSVPAGLVLVNGICVALPAVDLRITKSVTPSTAAVGQQVTWTINVRNLGPSTATGVVVTDTLPSQVTFVSVASTVGTCSGTTLITCNVGTLALNAEATITIVTRAITATAAGSPATNLAVVIATQPETSTANNTATATVPIAGTFTPPTGVCYNLNLATRSIVIGRRSVILVTVRTAGRIVRGATVVARGPGVNVRARTNNRGVARIAVRATRPGVIRFNALGQPTCAQRRVGVMGVFQPPLTG